VRIGVALLVACMVVSCSSDRVEKSDTDAVDQFVRQGYQPPRSEHVRSQAFQWDDAAGNAHADLLLPEKGGPAPLVVYLPGLGEDEQAGRRWTGAWAQAGYAVLSIQPLLEDAQAWNSDLALSGAFEAVARRGFSNASMRRRVQALDAALAQLARRAAAGDALLANVDLSRVAVAGFDLGAYAAMVVAGEKLDGGDRPALSVPVRAVIVFSPYAIGSAKAHGERYGAVAGPVMHITGPRDTDVIGLVASAELRSEPFELLPPGDKYLLSLAHGSHDLIGGADPAPRVHQPSTARSPRSGGIAGEDPNATKRSLKHPDSSADDSDRPVDADETVAREQAEHNSLTPSEVLTRQSMNSASVRIVTTAFLDAYLRNDAAARSWLTSSADRWLAPAASRLDIR
jgi:dienelactone hydrolase